MKASGVYFRHDVPAVRKDTWVPMMDDETKRRLVYGLLSLILGAIATRLAMYLTNRILGEPEDAF